MSAFKGKLLVEQMIPDVMWKLLIPLEYKSDIAKRSWKVPKGFLTTFANVPRAPFAYWLAGGTGNAAAVIHSYLYQTHERCRKTMADKVFYEAMGVTNVPLWRRYIMYKAVQWFGGYSWKGGAATMVRHNLSRTSGWL